MARPPNLISRIRDLISTRFRPVAAGENPSVPIVRRRGRVDLPFDEPIVRLILGDRNLTRDLCEVAYWSPEAIGVVDFLSGDPFQQIGGETGSWAIAATRDGKDDGAATHPNVLAVGRDLASRMVGREYLLGGDRLQSLVSNGLFFGDGVAELEFGLDGTGALTITGLTDRPSLQTFFEREDDEDVCYYSDGREIVPVPAWKLLRFSHAKRQGRYGKPLFLPHIDTSWRPCKATAADLADAIRAAGTAPLIHSLGKDASPEERARYQESVELKRDTQIVTDLFLVGGGSVSRVASDGSIGQLLDAFMNYRKAMIPAGMPTYLFPWFTGGDSGKDLAGQPALAYARKIANIRSQVGELVKWAIALEIVLRHGYDFYRQEGQFEITWGKWFVTGLESDLMAQEKPARNPQSDRMESMMRSLESRLQHSIDLANTARVIQEIERYDPT